MTPTRTLRRRRFAPLAAATLTLAIATLATGSCTVFSGWSDLQGGAACDGACDAPDDAARVDGSGIAFVQGATSQGASSGTTATASFKDAQRPGSTNVVAIGCNELAFVASVRDSSGNAYELAIGPTQDATGALSQWIYYAKNIKGAAAGANTITIEFASSVAGFDVRGAEYAGLDPAAPLDTTAGASGTGAQAQSGAKTTKFGAELIVGAGMTTVAYQAPGAMFTARALTPQGDLLEDRVVDATGSYEAAAPMVSSGRWVMQMATFH